MRCYQGHKKDLASYLEVIRGTILDPIDWAPMGQWLKARNDRNLKSITGDRYYTQIMFGHDGVHCVAIFPARSTDSILKEEVAEPYGAAEVIAALTTGCSKVCKSVLGNTYHKLISLYSSSDRTKF